MPNKPLGNLLTRSKSIADYADKVRTGREKVGEFLYDQAIDRLLPEQTPDDLKSMVTESSKFFLIWLEAALVTSPAGQAFAASPAAKKLAALSRRVPTIQRQLKSIAANGLYEPARRLLLVANANRMAFERNPLRIVDADLTPYQAKTQCLWSGTFAEFRTGTILTGPADPRGYFAIYIPGETRQLQGSFFVTRITCEFQTCLQ